MDKHFVNNKVIYISFIGFFMIYQVLFKSSVSANFYFALCKWVKFYNDVFFFIWKHPGTRNGDS